jgi:hypothetical protein
VSANVKAFRRNGLMAGLVFGGAVLVWWVFGEIQIDWNS